MTAFVAHAHELWDINYVAPMIDISKFTDIWFHARIVCLLVWTLRLCLTIYIPQWSQWIMAPLWDSLILNILRPGRWLCGWKQPLCLPTENKSFENVKILWQVMVSELNFEIRTPASNLGLHPKNIFCYPVGYPFLPSKILQSHFSS